MRALPAEFASYRWAPSTARSPRTVGLDPLEIVRFDGNVPAEPAPIARPGAIAGALADVNEYAHGGFPDARRGIARYAGVEPENVVLGAGADDLILLCARTFAGPGDSSRSQSRRRTRSSASRRSSPAPRSAARRRRSRSAAVRTTRPARSEQLPAARPLVVDEAYFEYAGETAVGLIDDGVVVLRTFSKSFGLAGARVGYALADAETAAELNRRQAPQPISGISAALALAALARSAGRARAGRRARALRTALRRSGSSRSRRARTSSSFPLDEPEAARRVAAARRARRAGLSRRHPLVDSRPRGRRPPARCARACARSATARRGRPGAARSTHPRDRRDAIPRSARARRGRSRRVQTGAGLYDHLLEQLAFHAGFDLALDGVGDLETGPHHTAEDAALALGEALDRALGDRRGIARYGDAVVPMDDALARAAVDLGGRSASEIKLELDPGLAEHVLRSLAQAGRLAINVEATGRDEHHVAEAAFKAVGRSLRAAVRLESDVLPSTKGRV